MMDSQNERSGPAPSPGVFIICLSLALAVVLALCGPTLGSRGLTNVGLLSLGRYSYACSASGITPALFSAERLLRKAVQWNPANSDAQRGLGLALAAMNRDCGALSAWRSAGDMTAELLERGEQARRVDKYEEALVWCKRAISLDPSLGDSWHCAGLAHEGLQQWQEAIAAYGQALQAERFERFGRSSPHYRLGKIYQRQLGPAQLDEALAAYNAAIARRGFTDDSEAADAYHSRGTIYDRKGRDPRESIAEYRHALTLDPEHLWAHLRLAEALFRACENVHLAESQAEKALALWPDNESRKWPYRILGDIYTDAGLTEEAVDAYQEALRIDPQDEWVEKALDELTSPADK